MPDVDRNLPRRLWSYRELPPLGCFRLDFESRAQYESPRCAGTHLHPCKGVLIWYSRLWPPCYMWSQDRQREVPQYCCPQKNMLFLSLHMPLGRQIKTGAAYSCAVSTRTGSRECKATMNGRPPFGRPPWGGLVHQKFYLRLSSSRIRKLLR